jgi:hypothetical protein
MNSKHSTETDYEDIAATRIYLTQKNKLIIKCVMMKEDEMRANVLMQTVHVSPS